MLGLPLLSELMPTCPDIDLTQELSMMGMMSTY